MIASALLSGRDVPQPGVRAPRCPATRAGPLRVGDVDPRSRPGPLSLNENGTVISRPSNSGIATCMAASIGVSAALDVRPGRRGRGQAQALEHRHVQGGQRADVPRSSSPPADASAATVPPAASTVTITASSRASRS